MGGPGRLLLPTVRRNQRAIRRSLGPGKEIREMSQLIADTSPCTLLFFHLTVVLKGKREEACHI